MTSDLTAHLPGIPSLLSVCQHSTVSFKGRLASTHTLPPRSRSAANISGLPGLFICSLTHLVASLPSKSSGTTFSSCCAPPLGWLGLLSAPTQPWGAVHQYLSFQPYLFKHQGSQTLTPAAFPDSNLGFWISCSTPLLGSHAAISSTSPPACCFSLLPAKTQAKSLASLLTPDPLSPTANLAAFWRLTFHSFSPPPPPPNTLASSLALPSLVCPPCSIG